MGFDSGTSDAVVGPDMLPSVTTEEEAAMRGVTYEIASGDLIPNLGDNDFLGVPDDEISQRLATQVAQVYTPLLGVKERLQCGCRVVFDNQ